MVMIRTLAALFVLLCVAQAQAASKPAPIENEIGNAHLAGQGSFRWFGFKIYDAELWVGEQGYRANDPESAKFALRLTYARDLYGKRIARSSIDEISKLGFGTSEQHEAWLKRMEELFPDVHEGTQISGIYLPGQGARFYLNGNLLGEIADREFARAFFAIWLDPRTSAASLRNSLLSSAQ
jgi:hypothetical protein